MNILDIIKDCILGPYFAKNYELEELTIGKFSDSQSVTNQSSFSNYASFKQTNDLEGKTSLIDQRMLRMYMRVWSGLSKCIQKTVNEGKCFVNLNLGYFYPLKNNIRRIAYSPIPELLEKYGCSLIEDDYNAMIANETVLCVLIIGNEGVCECRGLG